MYFWLTALVLRDGSFFNGAANAVSFTNKVAEMFKMIPHGFLTGNDHGRDWLNVVDPTPPEIRQAAQTLQIPERFLKRRLHEAPARPVVEEAGLLAFQLTVPRHLSDHQAGFELVPLSILLVPRYFATVSTKPLDFLNTVIQPDAPCKRWELILRIVQEVGVRYIHMARDVSREIASVEQELRVAQRHNVVYHGLDINDRLLELDLGLLQLEYVLDEMKPRMPKDSPEFMAEYDDARIEIRQAREQVDLEQDTLNEMLDAYTYVVHNNVNHIFKFMAALIILATIPLIIPASAAMNVPLGNFPKWRDGFTVVTSFLIIVELITGFTFYRKGWLKLS
jgi:magnesium transporter